tara:strand:+ start:132 stop:344 length:213 start_codon:yes stop_codon:yes gene_type:complete
MGTPMNEGINAVTLALSVEKYRTTPNTVNNEPIKIESFEIDVMIKQICRMWRTGQLVIPAKTLLLYCKEP